MNKYIKTLDCDFWRLYWTDTENEPQTNYDDRRIKDNWKQYNSDDKIVSEMALSRIQDIARIAVMSHIGKPLISYCERVKKYGGVAINEVGGYCTIKESEITQLVYSDKLPSDDCGTLVICENDRETYQDWIELMKQYDPNPTTISFFNSRSQIEINALLEKAEFVTFTTTFTTLEWFEKMLIATPKNAQIIGRCNDDEKWKEAESLAKEYGRTIKRIK